MFTFFKLLSAHTETDNAKTINKIVLFIFICIKSDAKVQLFNKKNKMAV